MRIDFTNRPTLTVKDATLTADSIAFREYLTKKSRVISLTEVDRIMHYKSSGAGKGAKIGLGLGIGYSLTEASVIEIRRNLYFREDALKRYFLFICGTTLVGTMIGAAFKNWKTIYQSSSPEGSGGIQIQPGLYSDQHSAGLSVKVLIW